MSTKKPVYTLKACLLRKLAMLSAEEPTAIVLYLKILANVGTRRRMIKGVMVERGQMTLRYRFENVFFGTSKKRYRKDRRFLVQTHLIDINRDGETAFLAIRNFDDIVKTSEKEKDCDL